MRTTLLAVSLLSTLSFAQSVTIDWERAKALHQRVSRGETLSADEQKYYDEAKRQHDAGRGSGAPAAASGESDADMRRAKDIHERKQSGQTLSADEEKFLADMMRKHGISNDASRPGSESEEMQKAREIHRRKESGQKVSAEEEKFIEEFKRKHGMGGGGASNGGDGQPVASAELLKSLVPLTELKAEYRGQDGGLYGGGRNEPPAALAGRAKNALAQVQPLDASGKPSADGRIVFISMGMSNTTQEFSIFKRIADVDPRKSDRLVIVDCAQGGRDARAWAQSDHPWEEAARRIEAAGVSLAQVQAMWVKQANAGPYTGFPAATNQLADDLKASLAKSRERFPNLRLVFLSSRTYGGYATTRLNPEPYAYEGAFAVRDLIRTQPAEGPVLLWGPYLWAAGENGRAFDSLKYSREDFGPDGTHPSDSGRQKVAEQLLGFFTSNAFAKPWFSR